MSLTEVVGKWVVDTYNWLMGANGMLYDTWQSGAEPHFCHHDAVATVEGQLEAVVANPCYLVFAAIL